MNTTENNKLIAEFMGFLIDGKFAIIEDEGNPLEEAMLLEEMEYHKSWDWLMPVTTKAFNKACEMSLNDVVGADDHRQKIMDAHTMFDKKETYKAVVEFIKWYNKNKEN